MKKNAGKRTVTGILAVAVTLLAGTATYAQTWVWTNADGDNDYMNGNNWMTNGVPGGPPEQDGDVQDDVAQINSNGVDKCVFASAATTDNINSVDVGVTAGFSGELEVNGPGILKATSHPSRYSRVGNNGGTGLVTVNGGTWEVNRFDAGRAGGVGTVVVNGGTFKVARGNGGYSIRLDITGDAGITQGNLEINGGLVTTRTGVLINDYGTLTVRGGASTIRIGGAGTGQSIFNVNSGGTLAVQVASNGLSAIEIDNDTATSYATFNAGSLLEPSFFGGHIETNSWIVMTLDDGDAGITDSGLALAAGVDPLWSFGITNNPVDEVDVLWVGYAGAEYVPPPPPEFVTNVYVEAVVPMSAEIWNLWDPEGQSSLAGQSSSGFTATFHETANPPPGYQPIVAQEFSAARDLSEVGQSVTVSFDVVLLNEADQNDRDFKVVFYDTGLNSSWYTGMDIGKENGSMNTRMLPYISVNTSTGNPEEDFVPGNYALLGLGYDSLPGIGSGIGGSGLTYSGVVNHVETTLTRVETNEVELSTVWTCAGGTGTGTLSYVFNETAPDYAQWAPIPDGKWDSVDGFGIMIYDAAPFSPLSEGSFKVSNFEVTYTDSVGVDFEYEIADIVVDSSDDVTLTLSDPVVGATYTVYATENIHLAPDEVGSYVAEAPGVLNIPAADLAPYTSDTGFMDVELPVIIVIE